MLEQGGSGREKDRACGSRGGTGGVPDAARTGVQPSRGAAHQPGPDRGQHGRVRIRRPGSAGFRDDHRELHSAQNSPPAARTSPPSTTASSTRSTSTTTGTGKRTSASGSVSTPTPGTRIPSSTTRASSRSLTDTDWNRPQTYSVTLVRHGRAGFSTAPSGPLGAGTPDGFGSREQTTVLGTNIPTPPDNIGPRSTPSYDALATAAHHDAAWRASDVFRRSAGRSVLRRPGLDLRPRGPAAVQPGAHHSLAGRQRARRCREFHHTQHRDPGSDRAVG